MRAVCAFTILAAAGCCARTGESSNGSDGAGTLPCTTEIGTGVRVGHFPDSTDYYVPIADYGEAQLYSMAPGSHFILISIRMKCPEPSPPPEDPEQVLLTAEGYVPALGSYAATALGGGAQAKRSSDGYVELRAYGFPLLRASEKKQLAAIMGQPIAVTVQAFKGDQVDPDELHPIGKAKKWMTLSTTVKPWEP